MKPSVPNSVEYSGKVEYDRENPPRMTVRRLPQGFHAQPMDGSQFACVGEKVLGRPSQSCEYQRAWAVVGGVDQTEVQRRLAVVLVPPGRIDLQSETDGRIEIRRHLILVAGRQLVLLGTEIGWMNDDGLLSTIRESKKELCKRVPGVVDSGQTGQLAVEGKSPGRIARSEGVHLPPTGIEIQLYVVLPKANTEAVRNRIARDLVLDQRTRLTADIHVLHELKSRKRTRLETTEAEVPA